MKKKYFFLVYIFVNLCDDEREQRNEPPPPHLIVVGWAVHPLGAGRESRVAPPPKAEISREMESPSLKSTPRCSSIFLDGGGGGKVTLLGRGGSFGLVVVLGWFFLITVLVFILVWLEFLLFMWGSNGDVGRYGSCRMLWFVFWLLPYKGGGGGVW